MNTAGEVNIMTIKSDRQRRAFFARLKGSISKAQRAYHIYGEKRRRAHISKLKKESAEIQKEEAKLLKQLRAQKEVEAEKARAQKLRNELAELKRIKFQHSLAGRTLSGAKSAYGSKTGKKIRKNIYKFLQG